MCIFIDGDRKMEVLRGKIGLRFLFLVLFLFFHQPTTFADRKPYIVHLGGSSQLSALTDAQTTESHFQILGSCVKGKLMAKKALLYSYTRNINGFAAYLTESEAETISKYDGVSYVSPSTTYKLQTTHSWEFLGLETNGAVPSQSLWAKAKYGEDVIIANIDTGVWPESESFKDEGMGPIPLRWKGICENHRDQKFQCNRKLIGARYFKKAYEAAFGQLNSTFSTPRDWKGHGTHTLSTAAGGFVPINNLYNFINGTAKGGSPRARVAAYKACWVPVNGSECVDADVLAAIDAAIKDGVDVISISLSATKPSANNIDNIAIGSFRAIKHGIIVVASAGNSGPQPGSVKNEVPWLITVGASSMDRLWESSVFFSSRYLKGQSLSSSFLPEEKQYPLISAIEANASNASQSQAKFCLKGSLDNNKVKGKIVVCLRGANEKIKKEEAVKMAGGVGMILCNNGTQIDDVTAEFHLLPATHISYKDGLQLQSYIKSTKSPRAYITPPRPELRVKPAPVIASFSSRGPNPAFPQILKPDIIAPGIEIIAAYSKPQDAGIDKIFTPFNIMSGTSSSCPHVAGVAGLLKALHPAWSPAAIKSAIMTTATTQDNMGKVFTDESSASANPFSYGSGHIQPNRAMNPGLVYDLNTTDYLNFLCAIGYNSSRISILEPHICPVKPTLPEDLNYPSITAPNLSHSITITRRLKNVGEPNTYTAQVESPRGVSVEVHPTCLKFDKVGEEKVFRITLKSTGGMMTKEYVFGSLVWSDGLHFVRSPIIIKSKDP